MPKKKERKLDENLRRVGTSKDDETTPPRRRLCNAAAVEHNILFDRKETDSFEPLFATVEHDGFQSFLLSFLLPTGQANP